MVAARKALWKAQTKLDPRRLVFIDESVLQSSGRSSTWTWALDLDIRACFDSIPHELLRKAVKKHTNCPWALLYIERWLQASVQLENGVLAQLEQFGCHFSDFAQGGANRIKGLRGSRR